MIETEVSMRSLGWFDLAIAFAMLVSGVLSFMFAAQLWRVRDQARVDLLCKLTVLLLSSLGTWGILMGTVTALEWHLGIRVATIPYAIISAGRVQLAGCVIAIILWGIPKIIRDR